MEKEQNKSNYKIIVDYGKPYDIDINTEKELKQEIQKLRELNYKEDFGYFSVTIEFKETEFIKKARKEFKKQDEYLDFNDYLINVSCC